jgi:hypothetical protein
MDQGKFRRDTAKASAVSISAMHRREQIAWLRDFVIGLAVAIGAGAVFAAAMSVSQAAWAALG